MRLSCSLFFCTLTVFAVGCGSATSTDAKLPQTRLVGLQDTADTDSTDSRSTPEVGTAGKQPADESLDPVAARYQQIKDLTEVYQRIATIFDGIESPAAIDAAAPGLIAQCIEVRSILEQSLSLPSLNASQREEFHEGFAEGLGAAADAALQDVARAAVSAFRRIPDNGRWEIVATEFSKVCEVIESHLPQLLEPLPQLPPAELQSL